MVPNRILIPLWNTNIIVYIRRPLPWRREGRRLGPPEVWNLLFHGHGPSLFHSGATPATAFCFSERLSNPSNAPAGLSKATLAATRPTHLFLRPAVCPASNPSNAPAGLSKATLAATRPSHLFLRAFKPRSHLRGLGDLADPWQTTRTPLLHFELTLKSASQFPHLPPCFEASAVYKNIKHVPCVNMTGLRFRLFDKQPWTLYLKNSGQTSPKQNQVLFAKVCVVCLSLDSSKLPSYTEETV